MKTKLFTLLLSIACPALCVDNTALYSLTLDKESGGINTAFYGGMVKNKLLYSSLYKDSSSETHRRCWFGTAPGIAGVLVKEKVKFYRRDLKKKKESRVEQAIYIDKNMASTIQEILKNYKSNSKKFVTALDSDKRTITLDILAQGKDKKLAKLAQTAIKKVSKACEGQI